MKTNKVSALRKKILILSYSSIACLSALIQQVIYIFHSRLARHEPTLSLDPIMRQYHAPFMDFKVVVADNAVVRRLIQPTSYSLTIFQAMAFGASVSAPLIFIILGWIIGACKWDLPTASRQYAVCIPVNIDVVNVAVHKTNHVFSIVIKWEFRWWHTLRIMPRFRTVPGIRKQRCVFSDQNCFAGVPYRTELHASDARPWASGGIFKNVSEQVATVEDIT